MYSNVINELKAPPNDGLEDAVLSMVRYSYADDEQQKQSRPTAGQLLTLLHNDGERAKRRRQDS